MAKITVLIPSYNCEDWIKRCLDSVKSQTVQPSKVVVIDDASTDPSYAEKTLKLCKQYGYTFLRNDKNEKCPYNLWLGVKILNPDENDIIFLLDGDDFLPHPNVFQRIKEVYQDENCWMTYGNYEPFPHNTGQTLAAAYPEEVIQTRSFRTSGNVFNHPITFRRFLFDQIKEDELKSDNGNWFRGGYDFAIMVPMLEMCGGEHYQFINETLYSYNAINPISDSQINVPLIMETDQLITRPKKDLLIR